jgi:hypothetical protein
MRKATSYAKNNPNLRQPKMSHIRHIKPEYFQHEAVAELQPFARLAWVGLWTNCDKHGRFEWKPKSLKIKILPFDDVDFESLLLELVAHDFVRRYEVAGQKYGYVPNWSKHQGIGTREKQSPAQYPAPANADTSEHGASTASAQCTACAVSEGVGEGQGEVKCKEKEEGEGEGSARKNTDRSIKRTAPESEPAKPETKTTNQKPSVGSVVSVIGFKSPTPPVSESQNQPINTTATVAVSPEDVFASARSRFRRIVGKNLGSWSSLGMRQGEWSALVKREGEPAVMAAIELWATENKDFLKNKCEFPLAHFLKNAKDSVADSRVESERPLSERAPANATGSANTEDDDFDNDELVRQLRQLAAAKKNRAKAS